MSDGADILAAYEEIAGLTARMLEAASAARWDELIALERQCATVFTRVIELDAPETPRSAEFQRRKAALIRRVLEDDARIRLLLEPWLEQLQELLGSTSRQLRLDKAYGC